MSWRQHRSRMRVSVERTAPEMRAARLHVEGAEDPRRAIPNATRKGNMVGKAEAGVFFWAAEVAGFHRQASSSGRRRSRSRDPEVVVGYGGVIMPSNPENRTEFVLEEALR